MEDRNGGDENGKSNEPKIDVFYQRKKRGRKEDKKPLIVGDDEKLPEKESEEEEDKRNKILKLSERLRRSTAKVICYNEDEETGSSRKSGVKRVKKDNVEHEKEKDDPNEKGGSRKGGVKKVKKDNVKREKEKDGPNENQITSNNNNNKKRELDNEDEDDEKSKGERRRNLFDENGVKIDSSMCHQCQRNDKGRVVRCFKCKTKRYCIPCIGNC